VKHDDSIYKLLSGLPHIKEEERPPDPAVTPKAEPDEITLFRDAMKDVNTIKREKARVARKADKTQAFSRDSTDVRKQLREAIEDHRAFRVTDLPEYMEGHAEDVNPLVMEKLRNGEFSVQKTLDLHGYSVADGYVVFQEFIREAVHSGLHCVKVIHGRGLKSRQKPVLKEKLKEWIVRAMHRKWIVAFSSSRMCEGGPGATCILLRWRPEKKKMHIAG
jgi:DNA-nicking Smr family endonuclease